MSAVFVSASATLFFIFLSLSFSACFLAVLAGSRLPQPPREKYCIVICIILDATQQSASPLAKVIDRKKNIKGIITVSICPCDFCWGSLAGCVVIFCDTHMLTPTSIAKKKSGTARFIHRKC